MQFYNFLAEDDYSTYTVQQLNMNTDVPEDAADTRKVLGTGWWAFYNANQKQEATLKKKSTEH